MTALDPRLVPAFLALADELHFGRAAERLHVSQPGLSQQLQRLERQLGVVLFDRDRHGVRLPETGAALLPAARAAHDAAEAFAERARELAGGARGELRLGVSPGAHYAVQGLLARFDVRRRTPPSATLAAAVRDGELDAALAYCVDDVEGVHRELLTRVRASVALHVGHPLAQADSLSLEDLRDERIALADDRDAPGYNRAVLAAFERAGIDPVTSDRHGGATAWEDAIDGGCAGLSSASDIHARSAAVRLVALRDEVRFPLYLLTTSRRPVVAAFAEAARQAFP